ncbi:MAG: SLBB domain-containing protein [Acidobacteria bacterium]|nr:SLBB domain-containing protein [Acidobacteriota bacterium]
MRIFVYPAAVCLILVSALAAISQDAAPTPDPTSGMTDKAERYRIGFQDVIDIQVFRHSDLTQKVAVSPTGTINLFRLDHPVVAVCKTERELETDIANAYKQNYLRDPEVHVVVSEQRSQPVAVIGAVEKPGSFFINRRYQLLEMLALAGGPNKEAGTRLLVARTGSTSNCRELQNEDTNASIMVSDYKIRDVQEGKVTFWMQPGDVISVLDADVVYVYGDVNKQGSIRVREPITLTQAIASGEGLKPTAKKGAVRILRQKRGGGDREELTFDLNQIDKGKVKDPYLEAGDIVAVSQDAAKKILLGIAATIKTSVPSAIYRIP